MRGPRARRAPGGISARLLLRACGLRRARRIARGSGGARIVRGGGDPRRGCLLRSEPALALSLVADDRLPRARSEEHTSELQSLMRISYAVFCLKKKTTNSNQHH